MMKHILLISLTIFVCSSTFAQVPMATQIQILKAEDARDYSAIRNLVFSSDNKIQKRAVLAAGRIGDEAAVPSLLVHLQNGDPDVRAMAAFALGEIESIKAADEILRLLGSDPSAGNAPPKLSESSRIAMRVAGNGNGASHKPTAPIVTPTARLLEAAGKVAAANANDPKSKELGAAIVKVLTDEEAKRTEPNTEAIRLGLTAVLRARPAGSEETVRKFLAFTDPNIVADALNTLARLRAKNANRDARDLLSTHTHAIVRANAARVLGAAEDKEAVDVLIKAATTDTDSRVRVSAIRALGALKDSKAADPLLARGESLLEMYKKNLKPNFKPVEQSEFIEISTALGQVLAKTGNSRANALFRDFDRVDQFRTPEPYIARVRLGGFRPGAGGSDDAPPPTEWRQFRTVVQVLGEMAAFEPDSEESKKIKEGALEHIRNIVKAFIAADPKQEPTAAMAAPDALQAFARFKSADLGEIARTALSNKDVQIRATAAGILADLPPSVENIDALNSAFNYAWENDVQSNDAILATMDALLKVDKQNSRASVTAFMLASGSPDQLVRAKALALLKDDAYKNKPELQTFLNSESAKKLSIVRPYSGTGTKNGQMLNKEIDYRRALSRKNGTVKAVVTTGKGSFTIDFLPEEAPLSVDNFIKLANTGYFNGVEVHRVVPNFVMQDGDPRGDGNGGPGWSIRCEINMVPYERGAVGMALSGKDTGGSQWFVTHSPQPHLDGGYTVFGKVNETGMKVVDNIVRGDKIISVRILRN